MTTWRLTALEFVTALDRVGVDRLPFPLTLLADTTVLDEYEMQRRAAAERIDALFDDRLRQVLEALVCPRIRLHATGFAPNNEITTRIYAGIGGQAAAVASQPHRPTTHRSPDIELTYTEPYDAAGVVIAALPVQPAGREPEIRIGRTELAGDGAILRTPDRTERDRAVGLLNRPYTTFGELLIDRGPQLDGRLGKGRSGFQWLDHPGDGRYLIDNAATITLTPASRDTLVGELGRRMALLHA